MTKKNGQLGSGPIGTHSTSTSAAPWDEAEQLRRLAARPGALAAGYRRAFAHFGADGDPDTLDAYGLAHHFVDALGAVGAASVEGARDAIVRLNTAGGPLEGESRSAAYAHLARHLSDAGEKPPALLDASTLSESMSASAHGDFEGNHAHTHAAYGATGGDGHSHEHMHAGDANHNHDHAGMSVEATTAAADTEAEPVDAVGSMTAALVADGSSWGIVQDGPAWVVVNAERGEIGRFAPGEGESDNTAASRAMARLGELAMMEPAPTSCGRFRSELIPEGTETSDGRMIAEKATKWSRLATQKTLPLMSQTVTEVGHFGAVLCGRMDTVSRDQNNVVVAEGDLDASEAGQCMCDIIEARGRFGVSVDLMEVEADFECTELDDEGWCVDGLLTVSAAELGGATCTPFPAYSEAFIEMADAAAANAASAGPRVVPCRECDEEQAIVAAIPVSPPPDWFADPQLTGPTPMTVGEDGRVFGHAWLWGSCHVGQADTCLAPPRSRTNYQGFRVGALRLSDGSEVAVGHITMTTGHASLSADPRSAAAHYDDTGAVVADVACGEDAYGGWFAGALRPAVTPTQVRELRASALSGDWRRIGGNLELVAMLAVNVPGFPVPRARVASGVEESLVAAGSAPLITTSDPHTEALADLERRLLSRLGRLEATVAPLRPLAQQTIAASVLGAAEGEPEPEPEVEPELATTAAQ